MKLAVAALIRNEIDIVGAFLQHLDALFDHVLLIDHGSIDGTDRVMAQACAGRPGWTLWHLDPVGYHQAAFSRFALGHLMRGTDADIVMFLDADEFIAVPDRTTLEASFARLAGPDYIGRLLWRDVVPERLDTRAIRPGEAIWRAPATSSLGKVVISRLFYAAHGHEAHLALGNHGLYYLPDRVVPSGIVGEISHLPIRSHTQLTGKVLAGVLSLMAQADRSPAQGRHWQDILGRIADGTLRDDDLIGFAAHYSEDGGQAAQPLSWADLRAGGFTRSFLYVAFGRPLPAVSEKPALDPVRLMATILRRFHIEDVRNSALVLEGDRLRFAPRAASVDTAP